MLEYGPLLVCGLFVIVGMIALRDGIVRFRLLETTGRVISAEVSHRVDPDGDTYGLDLIVEYHRGGRTLRGSPMSYYASGDLSKGAWERRAASYPPGSEVAVFYDPEDPTRFVVDQRVDLRAFVLGTIFLLAGLGGAWWTLTRR